MPMGPAFQRTTRAHPLAVHGIVGLYVGNRVFSHLRGRCQNVQVPGEGAQKNDFSLGNSLEAGNSGS